MTTSKRCQVVFNALSAMGRDVEISQWWQDVAFDLYDQAAFDDNAPSAITLRCWLENYHIS